MTTGRSFFYLCTIGIFCFISYNLIRMPVLALFNHWVRARSASG